MKYYYNKAQPNIEYGMLSSRRLNYPHRKPNVDGLIIYYYTSVKEPLVGTFYRNEDYYIIPAKKERNERNFSDKEFAGRDEVIQRQNFNKAKSNNKAGENYASK